MTPTDAQLIQLKQILTNENDNQLNLSKILLELIQYKQITPRSQVQRSMNIATFIQEFLTNESSSFELLCRELADLLEHFISQTSFSDTHERLSFIQRTISII
ncbi:unnamed protein product, partial [Rotaria magnacalcarata]